MNVFPLRIAVFASGGGSNFQAILEAVQTGILPASIDLLVCNKPGTGAHEKAQKNGITSIVVSPEQFATEEEYNATLFEALEQKDINFIALAGYLKRIPEQVVKSFHARILNIHPALLPAFGGKGMYGLNVHRAVIAYGARWTGVTVHLVDPEYDSGPVVLQEPVPVWEDDTPETLAARVLEVEHRLYPEAVRLFAENRIRLEGRRVYVLPAPPVE